MDGKAEMRDEPHPFDLLASALGGRRLYTLLWGFWLFAAVCGHYVQTLPHRESVTAGSKIAVVVCTTGLLTYSWLLIRGLSTVKRRSDLFEKRPPVQKVGLAFQLMVWVIPVLALGAVLAPAVIR